LLKADHPSEAYCAACDEFWAVSPPERAAIASEVNGRVATDSSSHQDGERPS
jgi:hypothetical protein